MLFKRLAIFTLVAAFHVSPLLAQQSVPGASPTAEQMARRKDALRATRTVNTMQANQPGSATRKYLPQADLPASPFAMKQTGASAEFLRKLNFTPGQDFLPGWELTLDVTADGYWFMVKDGTDPCGFAYVSNHKGLIFEARPIR